MLDRDLPPHVKSIVAEIETEIGEVNAAGPRSCCDGTRGRDRGHGRDDLEGSGATARVEAAVRGILREIGEDPDRPGPGGHARAGSTGCTRS